MAASARLTVLCKSSPDPFSISPRTECSQRRAPRQPTPPKTSRRRCRTPPERTVRCSYRFSESVPDAVDARRRPVLRPLLRFGKRGLTIDHAAIRNPPGGIVDVEQATFRAEARNDEQSSGIEVTALERRLGRICKAHQREPTVQLGPEREQRDEAKAHDQRTAAVATAPGAPQSDSGLSDATRARVGQVS